MSESGVPYKKRPLEPKKEVKVPPPPEIPNPNPEVPPPGGGPVPGEPIGGGQKQVYMCPVCGMSFSSKEELQLHMANNHPGSTKPNK